MKHHYDSISDAGQVQNGGTRSRGREVLSWAAWLLGAVVLALLLRFFVFEIVIVKGPSMQPTLHTGQNVFIEKVSKRFDGGIDYGEIVVVHYPLEDEEIIKRVIGLPGDTIEVRDGLLYRNGARVEEPYLNEPLMSFDMDEVTVPEGHYFVMGDNRNESMDSRSASVGPIPEADVIGHALCIIWPVSEWKGLG